MLYTSIFTNPKPPIRPISSSTEPTKPQPSQQKPSLKLNNWSRTRSLRSGQKINRISEPKPKPIIRVEEPVYYPGRTGEIINGEDEGEVREAKVIYMVSDGTGWTAENSVSTALGQFENCLVDYSCRVETRLFSGVEDIERLLEIVIQAAKEGAMLVYTLADPSMSEAAQKACRHWNVPCTDILGPITEAISTHLGVSPSGLPRGVSRTVLGEDYFKRIEAIEFTIKQDDGALPHNLLKADIVLAGVSRTGKTPLSIYLAQKGYKVANIPIVVGLTLPETLFEIDPDKVFGLTIDPNVLQTIRRSRAKTMGVGGREMYNYSDMEYVKKELEHARNVFARNPSWPVIEVTGKAIEETAAIILRLYHDKKQKRSVPSISKRY